MLTVEATGDAVMVQMVFRSAERLQVTEKRSKKSFLCMVLFFKK
jgi:hypothetical protein